MGNAVLQKRSGFPLERTLHHRPYREAALWNRYSCRGKAWGATAGEDAADRDVTFRAAADGAYILSVTFFKVRDEFLVSPVLPEVGNQREFIDLELLVFWRMGIVESPLLERDISADKVY